MYDKPKVTIDLEEYNTLLNSKKERDEDEYELVKKITARLLNFILNKDPNLYKNLLNGIEADVGIRVAIHFKEGNPELLVYKKQ